ncbi:FliM/FliN family flagellar motor switch protein [Sphingomonas morindae]|uniref:FliM/FliN family flagellar motor C-terminal domain-containing protein n=1 Tax=Sphingomonas morindae TaxID=1541170 RepID=A0ABY4X569_9SPHN|nr:FliM/FliN family flagellar motor C-terminal domain-containing protein [Sphingomonas morindae]USI72001.1 FliM/FliN family flagellar motor C-terminal domain-containing protein [Sphingomonas morindae]
MDVSDGVPIEVTVELGARELPIRQVLRLGRGATIPLSCHQNDPSLLYVGEDLIGEARIVAEEDRMVVEVLRLVGRKD